MVDRSGNLVLLDFGCLKEFEPAFADGIFNILRAVWAGEAEMLPGLLRGAGFSIEDDQIDVEVLYEWLELMLAPFMRDAPFDFTDWDFEIRGKRFLFDHPELLRVLPPNPAIFYLRVCAGVRGILTQAHARINVYALCKSVEGRLGGRV